MRHSFYAPRLLLSLRSLVGVSLATRDRALDVVARYREPETLAVTLSKALDAGADGVLASPTPALGAALAELRRGVPTFAVLPVLSEHERHELEPGIEDVLSRNRRRAGLTARLRFGLAELARPAAFFHGDLVARLPLLIESEATAIRSRDLKGVVLDAWLTDLALAAGHREFFESFCRLVRRRVRGAAGFETHNLGLLLARFREWKIHPDLVVGPVNPCGLGMKPSAAEVLDELARTEVAVLAKELRAGGVVTLEHGALFAHGHRIHGLALDLTEMDDVAGDLKACLALSGAPAEA